MRAGVRKAGPLPKNSPLHHPPNRAKRADLKPRGRHHAPPPTSYYYYIIIIIILNIKHSEHKILNLYANAMPSNFRSRSLSLSLLNLSLSLFFP